MSTLSTGGRGLVALSLRDVPIVVRRRYGRRLVDLAAENGDLIGAVRLREAIENPSEKRYVIPRDAFERVLGARP
jgi:hypothetical protein